ncbi:hypothetical protein AALP_AAs55560U000800 [Arabis alpina]|uniref:Cystatin domain-containing protein n=1 Tax=Arabis alpina TaxID=50452 RepID=A0A087G3Q4_ARAAL|nr:hypothetical protein AALP_AAs55560U000800 [Arabis alpina]
MGVSWAPMSAAWTPMRPGTSVSQGSDIGATACHRYHCSVTSVPDNFGLCSAFSWLCDLSDAALMTSPGVNIASKVPLPVGKIRPQQLAPQLLKKQKTDPVSEAEASDAEIKKVGADSTEMERVPESKAPERRIRCRGKWNDHEYMRQLDMFGEQYEKSQGYDIDWDNLDFYFDTLRLEDGLSYDEELNNRELVEMLIKIGIKEVNEENDIQLEFVKYVSANVQLVQGFLFYITFWAKVVSTSNQEPQLYQAEVRKFGDEIFVNEFRLRPTQECYR